jgi:predicted phage terminase large subunit-like protein
MTSPLPSDALELSRLLTPRLNKYIPWEPTPTQAALLLLDKKEALYGGAAGGGKSVALLAAALQYVEVPGYNALLLRRTFAALCKPEALIPLSHEWLQGTDAQWNEKRYQWTFPSGATLSFGYLDTEGDKYQYQGAAYHYVGFDELTQFTQTQYTYLFSRCRRKKAIPGQPPPPSSKIPLRVRSASNPGGAGHEWVKHRFFVEGPTKGRVFIPAKLADNPHLDAESYREMLAELPLVERLQLENGNWDALRAGDYFQRDWWQYVDGRDLPPLRRKVRYWDTASTKPNQRNKDPDWYCGVLVSEFAGRFYVEDVVRFRKGPAGVEDELKATLERDGHDVEVWMQQEPGSQSVALLDVYARTLFKGYSFRWETASTNKVQRAKPLSSANSPNPKAGTPGNVFIVRATWNTDFTAELEAFPQPGVHDDQVDAASGAHQKLSQFAVSTPKAAEATHVPPLRRVGM